MVNVELKVTSMRLQSFNARHSTFDTPGLSFSHFEFCVLRSAFLFLLFLVLSCTSRNDDITTIRFWGLGREGEVVEQLLPQFHRENPDIRVRVQQIPWTAAHEKLLTAYVGESTPDVSQMGNTWVPEFHAINALENLEPWIARSSIINERDQFPGIWQTNVLDGAAYGIPWYVDTRVLFYRTDILARAGFKEPPKTWSEWLRAMEAIKGMGGRNRWAILLPTNEWPQPVIFGLQQGSPLLAQDGRYGAFSQPEFASAFDFYMSLFRRGYAPVLANAQIANVYQQFGEGEFAMYITGPWNVGEFERRLPAEMQDKWATAPMPTPDGQPYPGLSLAGGSSLVLFKSSEKKDAAWKLIEFLSRADQQKRFWELSGNLPALRTVWQDPRLAGDPHLASFGRQLERVVPTPKVPEWEQIATTVYEFGETAVRGGMTPKQALAALDAKTNWILEKRRWVLAREQ
jgi:multiple sugar transport system substrate-binding protein